jgi:Na+/H+-dicarboxylate symporter
MAAATSDFRVFGLSQVQQVIIGIIAGCLVGYFFKALAPDLKIIGTIFIDLIKMVVVPLIFLALVTGITSMNDAENFKRVGVKTIGAYLLTSIFAVILGLTAGYILSPGDGITFDAASMGDTPDPILSKEPMNMTKFILSIIPTNAIRAMAEDQYLQVVLFAVFTGVTMNILGDSVSKAREITNEFAKIYFRMIEIIVRLAPLAVFGFIAWMVGTQGIDVIISLLKLVEAVLLACGIQYIVFGLMILVFARINPLPFYRKMLTTQIMAFSTSSSKATLTTAMREVTERVGVSEKTTNFVLPLGACINMDGTAIYLGICALFFAQIFGVHLDFYDYLVLILTCTLGSIGAAGIPSGSIIFMGMVLHSVGIPIQGIGIILGVDRLLDMVRTTVNITGDSAITLIIGATEGQLDKKVYYDKSL